MSRIIARNEPATKDVTAAEHTHAGARMDGERRSAGTVAEDTTRPTAQPACGVKRCYLPWADHLTKKGTLRVALKDHRPASARAPMANFGRAARRGNRHGLDFFTGTRRSAAASRKAPGSFRTHTVDLSVPRADRKREPIRHEYAPR